MLLWLSVVWVGLLLWCVYVLRCAIGVVVSCGFHVRWLCWGVVVYVCVMCLCLLCCVCFVLCFVECLVWLLFVLLCVYVLLRCVLLCCVLLFVFGV